MCARARARVLVCTWNLQIAPTPFPKLCSPLPTAKRAAKLQQGKSEISKGEQAIAEPEKVQGCGNFHAEQSGESEDVEKGEEGKVIKIAVEQRESEKESLKSVENEIFEDVQANHRQEVKLLTQVHVHDHDEEEENEVEDKEKDDHGMQETSDKEEEEGEEHEQRGGREKRMILKIEGLGKLLSCKIKPTATLDMLKVCAYVRSLYTLSVSPTAPPVSASCSLLCRFFSRLHYARGKGSSQSALISW